MFYVALENEPKEQPISMFSGVEADLHKMFCFF